MDENDRAAKELFDTMPSNHPSGPPIWEHQPERIKNVFRVKMKKLCEKSTGGVK